MSDEADFDALYTRQHERLVTALVLAGSDQPSAEDLAHEAFVRVLVAWRRVRDPDAYLYRTAFRLQARTRRRATRGASLSPSWVAPPRSPDALALERHEAADLLDRLPPRQRACMVLVLYVGCSTEEAARHLGIRPATVRVHLHAARSALRDRKLENIEID